jgi:hypothetical protein
MKEHIMSVMECYSDMSDEELDQKEISPPPFFLSVRVESLRRDLWSAVTCQYYNLLHSLEEEGYLDLSNSIHLFFVGYVFLPHLRADLQHFTESRNNHPLSTKANLTPHQLWHIGMLQTPVHIFVFALALHS